MTFVALEGPAITALLSSPAWQTMTAFEVAEAIDDGATPDDLLTGVFTAADLVTAGAASGAKAVKSVTVRVVGFDGRLATAARRTVTIFKNKATGAYFQRAAASTLGATTAEQQVARWVEVAPGIKQRRVLDFLVDGVGTEVKAGRVGAFRACAQAVKDGLLVRSVDPAVKIERCVWLYGPSPVTTLSGPTPLAYACVALAGCSQALCNTVDTEAGASLGNCFELLGPATLGGAVDLARPTLQQ